LALALSSGGCSRQAAFGRYSAGPTGTPRRGGSVVFVREEDPDYLDPALSYGSFTAPLIETVFRTLLDYDDVPGIAGSRLKPDLAEAMPEVREGGRLYCFKIRRDARFSAPLSRHINATDFKYAIERLFLLSSPGAPFYRHIVGAEAMMAGKDSVLPGVIAHGDSLYVRLTDPDPIFLSVFSMSFTSPLPREWVERWPNRFSQHTISSGPFRVAEYLPRRRVLLVRNPDYCGEPAWLDTFELRLSVSTINAVSMIRRGQADGGFFEVPAPEYARLRADSLWNRQLEVADAIGTWYLYMNVRHPPFNDVRVRQAVCWALDRRAIVKVWSGKAIPAGEILPPSMPGAVALQKYQGPDTARARALLRAAGYPNGIDVTLHGFTTEPSSREAAVVQQNLADAGIRAKLALSEAVAYTSFAEDTTNHVAFGQYGWFADYLDPSNFFDTLFNGHHILPIHNTNLSLYDNPDVNARIERAMTTADDSLRAREWTEVDRRIMDDAVVCPTVHTLTSRLYSPRVGGWYHHVTRLLKIEGLYLKRPETPAPAVASR
jgi:peptide/nickel transport system substrate-binding protein